MKKLLQLSLLLTIFSCSLNANAAFLDWNQGASPAGATFKDYDTVLTSNIDIASKTPFDLKWSFVNNGGAGVTSAFTTFSFNWVGNFNISAVYFNGTQVAGTLITQLGALLNPVGVNNTLRIVGATTAVGNDMDVRIQATPIPAAVWLFGSALLGLGSLSSRRKASSAA